MVALPIDPPLRTLWPLDLLALCDQVERDEVPPRDPDAPGLAYYLPGGDVEND